MCCLPQLHLEICLKDLQEDYMGGTDVKISEPVVSYRETVSAESSQQCLSKSPNKHNRLYLSACPLESGIPEDVEEGRLNPRDDAKVSTSLGVFSDRSWVREREASVLRFPLCCCGDMSVQVPVCLW